MRWPIRYQLLVPLLVLLVSVVIGSVWTATTSANRARQRIENRVRDSGRSLETSWYPIDADSVLPVIQRYSGMEYYVVRKSGRPISTFDRSTTILLPPENAVSEHADELRLGPRVVVNNKAYRCSGLRLANNEYNPGIGVVYILYPDDELQSAVWEAIWPVLLFGGALSFGLVGLVIVVSQRLSRRLLDLERRTRLIAEGNFSPMPLPARNDEIRDLAKSVNEMANKLAHFQENLRTTERLRVLGQVSGGLAHQLRNGVAGARLAIQLYVRETTAQTDIAALDVALRQLTKLETNLQRFFDLGSDKAIHREPCDLVRLVAEAVDLLRPQCQHAKTDLRWLAPTRPATVLADRSQVEQLIFNVLGNAVEAAGPGGWVEVVQSFEPIAENGSEKNGSLVVLEIADSGPGPPAAIAPRLFEPFVTGKQEGVGLGLAVARQFAEGMGGRITWQREAERTCFRIVLPAVTSFDSSATTMGKVGV
jgi:signal transduction histidine kinase